LGAACGIGWPVAGGALASGVWCAVLTGYIKANSRVKEDTVMGVVFTGLFAFGLVIFTKVPSDLHLDHILFGNILGLAPGDMRDTLIVAGGALVVILVLRRDLLLYCFDSGHARTIGLRTGVLYYLLLSLLAVTIVVSLKAVGIILVIAMLVTPGCIGYLLTDRFNVMMAIATGMAVWAPTEAWFWVAAGLLGIFVGPNQAASRSLMGRFVPEKHQSEFFGFFSFSGKATAFMGPILLGELTKHFSHRVGMASVILFFVVGGILMMTVDEKKGIASAGTA